MGERGWASGGGAEGVFQQRSRRSGLQGEQEESTLLAVMTGTFVQKQLGVCDTGEVEVN